MQERGHDGDLEPCLGGKTGEALASVAGAWSRLCPGSDRVLPPDANSLRDHLGKEAHGLLRLPRALLAGVHAEKVPWGLAELEGGSDTRPLWVSRLPGAGLPGHVSGKQVHSLSGYKCPQKFPVGHMAYAQLYTNFA